MKDLIIIGASGYGREVYDMVLRINETTPQYNVLGFIDDDKKLHNERVNGLDVLGGLDYIKEKSNDNPIYAAIAIASADAKRKIHIELNDYVIWENLIDSTAIISSYCNIGYGNIIGPFTQIGPNSTVGNFCSIVYACSVGHDAILEDYVSAMDYCDITGYDYLEEGVYLGSSVAITPNVRITKDCILGAGAVVVKDINESGTYIGVPAVKIK